MSNRRVVTAALLALVLVLTVGKLDLGITYSDGSVFRFSNGFTSLRVIHRGEVDLTPDRRGIARLEPDGYLSIEERGFLTRRRLEVTAGAGGEPVYRYTVRRERKTDDEARAWLADQLPRVLAETTLGARSAARELFASGGAGAVLDALPEVSSDRARQIYLEELARLAPVEERLAERLAEAAARWIGSSSRLRETLLFLESHVSRSPAATAALVVAAGAVDSSSGRRQLLVELARARRLDGAAPQPLARVVAGIPSSSDQASTVLSLADLYPDDPEVLVGLVEGAAGIDSSSERRRALAAVVTRPGAGDALAREVAAQAGELPSSSDQRQLLEEVVGSRRELSAPTAEAVLAAGARIASSSERARALEVLLERPDLPAAVFAGLVREAADLPSSGDATRTLEGAVAVVPPDETSQIALADAAGRLRSSSGQRRVLLALLEREDLRETVLRRVTEVAQRTITGRSDREAVVAAARERLEARRPPSSGGADPPSPEASDL